INFFRSKGGIESDHDYTYLVFTSPNTLETFSQKVNALNLPLKSYFTDREEINAQFFLFSNPVDSHKLTLTDKRMGKEPSTIPEDIEPIVTFWELYAYTSNNRARNINIHYAHIRRNNVFWKDDRNIIKDNIVVVMLSR